MVGVPGDNWWPLLQRLEVCGEQTQRLDLAADGWVDVEVSPATPATKGGYALILDLGPLGRRYATSMIRTFKPSGERVQFPKQALEEMPPTILERLGIQAVRFGIPYVPSERNEAAEKWDALAAELAEYHAHGVTVTVEIGCYNYQKEQPLGRGRPHLDADGMMKQGKEDLVWLPAYDDDYQDFCYRIARDFGWPKGPVTGCMLWNEPWEGQSISGWGADMIRYRELYRRMGDAIFKARANDGVDVLIGGCDSSTNTWDKLFPDGDFATWMPYLDFCSIHYQGLSSPVLHPEWNQRTDYKGRVLIWDTESWVANSVDRIPGVVATNRAVGYDRSMGHLSRISVSTLSHGRIAYDKIQTAEGVKKVPRHIESRPTAAAIGAVQHLIGERDFDRVLFARALPWVYLFKGLPGRAEDGTVVVLGDIETLFGKPTLWNTVESIAGRDQAAALRRKLADLPADAAERKPIEAELKGLRHLIDAHFRIELPAGCQAFDPVGNVLPAGDGVLDIPVDERGFYLRADPQQPGSFAALVAALEHGSLSGMEPVHILSRESTGIGRPFQVRLTNILTRPLEGRLEASIAGQALPAIADIHLDAQGQAWFDLTLPATLRGDNAYAVDLHFISDSDGDADHHEVLHCNQIARRSVVIDGNLDDWKGCLPQVIGGDQRVGRSVEEAMWTPFAVPSEDAQTGQTTLWLAADDTGFAFAAKIVDRTEFPGTLRFATRDQDADFYPEHCASVDKNGKRQEFTWPEGVRRFSYRRWPAIPSSMPQRKADNVLLAFNAIPLGQDGLLATLPGRPVKFIAYGSTDYEFAFNKVHADYGGGTEVWRVQVPGLPRKHFFPRQPAHPLEGPAQGARCAIRYVDGLRMVEGFLPWSEIPEVQALRAAGTPVALALRINDSEGTTVDSNAGRSVGEGTSLCFHPDWRSGDPNEVAFGWE
jgi:hypothetical protein